MRIYLESDKTIIVRQQHTT